MKHRSLYLEWLVKNPKIKYDFRLSGISSFPFDLDLGNIDLGTNFSHGNPGATKTFAKRYNVPSANIFLSSEGASGQNARIIRYLAEKYPEKKEAIVEYPIYEPLLRLVQEYFPRVKRFVRNEKSGYRFDTAQLRRMVSDSTGLLVITNPHAPSGALSTKNDLKEIMAVAQENRFYVLCDEIYAEFDRKSVPHLFSIDSEWGIVTTSYTKAYGLGGLKLGVALMNEELVDNLYEDVLNTVGNSPNIVQHVAMELFTKRKTLLEQHQKKWIGLKKGTEQWLKENNLDYYPNKVGITYWIKTLKNDTYKWVTNHALPRYSVAPVPGTFFLFKNGYELMSSPMIRIGLGGFDPKQSILQESLDALRIALF